MRIRLLVLFLMGSLLVLANDGVRDTVKVNENLRDSSFWIGIDTVNIIEVEIVKPRLSRLSELDNLIEVPSSQISNYQSENISELLSKTTFGVVTSNGANGGSASIRLRGGSSEHTTVLWNGLPINSLTLGSADLSMINVGAFDQIKVINGAIGAKYGSGTQGGAVELNNAPVFNDNVGGSVYGEYASFNTYKASSQVSISNSVLSYSGQVFGYSSKNNFTFKDVLAIGTPEKTMKNADVHGFGTMHNLGIKVHQHLFNIGLWYQFKDYNILPQMGRGDAISVNNQKDSTLKAIVNWKHIIADWRFEAMSGYVHDKLIYSVQGVTENIIESKRSINSFYATRSIGSLNFEGGLRYNYLKAESFKYPKGIYENELGASLNMTYRKGRHTIAVFGSKEWNSVKNAPLMIAFSNRYKASDELAVRSKIASHYRRPSFNDRYWEPGNPDVRAEEGWNGELGAEYKIWSGTNSEVAIDQTAYITNNQETIMWASVNSELKAINTGKTKSLGTETKISYNNNNNRRQLSSALLYAYGHHTFNDKTLPNYKEDVYYKPRHLLRAWITYKLPQVEVTLNNSYQSSSKNPDGYTVDGFLLADVIVHFVPFKSLSNLKLTGKVLNVLNTNYSSIYKYAQPRRNYSISVNLIL